MSTNSDHGLLRPITKQAIAAESIVEGYLPLAMPTTLAGDQGVGKSLIADDLTIHMATGEPFNGIPVRKGVSVILDAENPEAQVLRPRLMVAAQALGYDFEELEAEGRVLIVKPNQFCSFPEDGDTLIAALTSLRERILDDEAILLRIDPITAFLGRAKSKQVEDIRGIIRPLAEAGGAIDMTPLFLTHLTKSRDAAEPLSLILGSGAQTHASRSVLFACRDSRDPELRYLWCEKNSIGILGAPLAYRIETTTLALPNRRGHLVPKEIARIAWTGEVPPSHGELADMLLYREERAQGHSSKEDRAAAALTRRLLLRGPQPSLELEESVRAELDETIGVGTMSRARAKANVTATKGADGRCVAYLADVHTEEEALLVLKVGSAG